MDRAAPPNIFLDVNIFGSSPSAGRNVFVADLSTGFVINWRNSNMYHALVYRTKEFKRPDRAPGLRHRSVNCTF